MPVRYCVTTLPRVNLFAMQNFGRRLKEFRKKLGLSQMELSQKSGISQASIARIEANKQKNLKSETMEKLTETLGVTLHEFLEGPSMVREEIAPYGSARMLPVVSFKDLRSKEIPSLLKGIAVVFEPALTQAEDAFFLKGTVPIISPPYVNEGDLLLVEPHGEVRDNDLVLFLSQNETFVGNCFIDLPSYIIRPLKQSQRPVVFTRKKRHIKIMRIGEIRKKS
jgi:DNA-binding Xre family transcriptional regulator